MNPELEKLIDLELADGVLTDKERTVLQKRAESLSVDQDEFEIILEGKLQLAQKAAEPPSPAEGKNGKYNRMDPRNYSYSSCDSCYKT